MKEDKNTDWGIVSLDGAILRVKISHMSRGRFKIVEDTKNGQYIDKIVDASDIIQIEKK